jgi:hypothetical protein
MKFCFRLRCGGGLRAIACVPAALLEGKFTVTNPIVGSQQFFRLSAP